MRRYDGVAAQPDGQAVPDGTNYPATIVPSVPSSREVCIAKSNYQKVAAVGGQADAAGGAVGSGWYAMRYQLLWP